MAPASTTDAILVPPLPDHHKDQDKEPDREGAERRGGSRRDNRQRVASQRGGLATQQLKRGPALSQQANPHVRTSLTLVSL